YFVSGVSLIIPVGLVFILILNLFKENFAFLIFGSSHYSYLIPPISLVICGLLLHALCYSYFRGRLLMIKANILQMINMGIIPLFAFTMSNTTQQVLGITGIGILIISTTFFSFIIKDIKRERLDILSRGKELLGYGLQRVPGDFGMAALLSLPAIFTAHIAGVKDAGYVAFGISLLNMIGTAFAPIGLIMLPKASQLIGSKDLYRLKYYILKLLKIAFLLTTVGVTFFELFADKIITLYLGRAFSDIVLVARVIMIGVLPYAIYVSMRSIIDAYYVKAVNTMNIVIALLIFLMLSGITTAMLKSYSIIISFLIAIFILGGLTIFGVRKIIREE
ncbi:MAG: lipopolysaccharide biosynthesis protein, partial [Candidatus Hydrogenedens sp.]